MKKSLFIAALATVALASCSNDEVLEMKQDQIKFTAVTGKASRGTEVTASSLESFNVWGWVEQTGTGNADYETLYFSDVEFKKNEDNNLFESTTNYWWPTGAMKFYATNLNLDIEEGSVTYTVNNVVASQEDFLYAAKYGVTKPGDGGVADLNFRHALSQIEFNVGLEEVTNNDELPLEVVITSIKVNNLDGSAEFTMPAGSTNPYYNDDPYKKDGTLVPTENDNSWGRWSNNDDADVSYTITKSETIRNGHFTDETGDDEGDDKVTTDFVAYGGTDNERMFLIPQSLEGSSIVVNCDIYAKGENKVKVHTGELTYNFANEAEWKQGMKYVYNLKFGVTSLQEIKFSVTVDKYQTATGAPIEVE